MPKQVAFLRGINLGRRRLKMDRLREVVEAAGLDGVDTYLASGNVVFDEVDGPADRLERRLEDHLRDTLGYEVDTFVRSMDALRTVAGVDDHARAEEDGFKIHVMFLHDPPDEDLAAHLRTLETPDDRFLLLEREICWLRRGRLSDSAIPSSDVAGLTGGATATMRTLNTVRRIIKKYG